MGAALPTRAMQPIALTPSRYVTIDLAVQITGLTRRAIESKITRGVWLLGRHYRKVDGGILIDMKGYEQWVDKATV